ncbi:amidohydrolase family protein [bacterium]|nr:amidohydrolase family protein [bacterium]
MIIDVHTHLGKDANFYYPDVSIKKILYIMDKLGIDKICSSHLACLGGEFGYGYKETLKAFDEGKKRIYGYFVYNPNLIKESLYWMKKHRDDKRFIGIKIHPAFHQSFPHVDEYVPLWKYAENFSLPVLTHSWERDVNNPRQSFSQPHLFSQVLDKYPKLRLILAHSGGRYHGHLQAITLAKKYKNVYLDLAGDSFSFGLIEHLVKEVGSKKILFGSDLTWIDPRANLGRIFQAKITDKDKEKILGLNAVNLWKGEKKDVSDFEGI